MQWNQFYHYNHSHCTIQKTGLINGSSFLQLHCTGRGVVKGRCHGISAELCQAADGDALQYDDTHHVCRGCDQETWGDPTDHIWEARDNSKVRKGEGLR